MSNFFVTSWTAVHQAPLSMGFSRREYWSGLPCPHPGIFQTQGLNPGFMNCRQILYHLSHQGSLFTLIYLQQIKIQMYKVVDGSMAYNCKISDTTKMPMLGNCFSKLWHIRTMEYNAAMKKEAHACISLFCPLREPRSMTLQKDEHRYFPNLGV